MLRLRMAWDSAPRAGLTLMNTLNPPWGRSMRGNPPRLPASFSSRLPWGSSRLLSRSSTAGLHRLAFSSSSQAPDSAASVRGPSSHWNLRGGAAWGSCGVGRGEGERAAWLLGLAGDYGGSC